MRKMTLLVLACSTLAAAAAPAFAQPPGGGFGPPGSDRRGDDRRGDFDRRGDERRSADFQRELVQINNRVEEDFRRGIISKKVAKAFFNRIQELQKAEGRARQKNGGYLRPDQRRDMDNAIDRVRSDLRLNEDRGGRGRR
jgi:hypothetical protein